MAGSIVGGIQQSQELKTQAGLAERNSKIELINAKTDEAIGAIAEYRQAESADAAMSTLETALASQGRVGGGVTDLNIRGETRSELIKENEMIGYETIVAAKEHTEQSKMDIFQKNMLLTNAKRKLIGGFMNAAGYGASAFTRMGGGGQQPYTQQSYSQGYTGKYSVPYASPQTGYSASPYGGSGASFTPQTSNPMSTFFRGY